MGNVGTAPNETSRPTPHHTKTDVGFRLYERGLTMTKKATAITRTVSKGLTASNRASEEAKLAKSASGLAQDAINAAVAAACAAERTSNTAKGEKAKDHVDIKRIAHDARSAAEDAVARAKEAIFAEDNNNLVDAVYSANLAAKAAQRAGSLAAAAAVIAGKAQKMASAMPASEPAITVKEGRESRKKANDRGLSAAIDHAACFLVTYNGRIIATCASEDDAFLLESELADLDRARDTKSGKCEVIERRTGRRLGGYLLSGGKMLVFLRDEDFGKRYGRRSG